MGFNIKASGIRKGIAGGGVAALLIATPFVGQWEGLRTSAYLDPVGIPTICYGSTHGVKIGQEKTVAECDQLLETELIEYYRAVEEGIDVPLPPARAAALTSFAYNVGISNFNRSTLRRLMNEGKTRQACDELGKWVFAKGMKLRGLVRRREAERQLCLEGLPQDV
jgi:lysozyme